MPMKNLPPALPMAENFLSDNNKTRKQQMSKSRTEIQKKRRAYIDKCHKDGVTPLPMDQWLKGDSAKKSKPVKKDSNSKKVAAKSETHKKESGRKVTIRRGDKVVFDDYTSEELAEFATDVLRLALKTFGRGK